MIVVVLGLEIDEQWRPTVDAKGCRREERAFGAVGGPVAKDAPRRAQRVAIGLGVVGQPVEIRLHTLRRVQTPQRGELASRQSVHELEEFRRAVLP